MHDTFMRRCLELAGNGRGSTGINPLVGSVLVRDGKVIAEGWHAGFGEAHAECMLLQNYEQKISTKDVLYVNLEPCYHEGKTPPCTDIILQKGIKKVVVGMVDPHMAGRGIDILKSNGVTVEGLVLPELCERLNRGFISMQQTRRPWITLKHAQAVDGSVSNPDGSFKKITDAEQDAWSHEYLRATHDAILVGVETVARDNPQLTTRVEGKDLPSPWKIILDPHGRTPVDARALDDQCILVTDEESDVSAFEKRGVMCWKIPLRDSVFDWKVLWNQCFTPVGSFHGITSILVEGGPRTWQKFHEAGVVDEEVTLVGA